MPYLVEFLLILVGFVLLVVGADKLVEAASNIAARFGMPERVIGLGLHARTLVSDLLLEHRNLRGRRRLISGTALRNRERNPGRPQANHHRECDGRGDRMSSLTHRHHPPQR